MTGEPRGPGGRGRTLDPDAETARLHVLVPAPLLERLDAAAEAHDKSRSQAVREACEEWLEEHE